MEVPTLKVGAYRGQRIYVRKIGRETFEYLIPFEGQVFANQVEIAKPSGQRQRNYNDEELKSCIHLMMSAGEDWVDDALFKKEINDQWQNRLKRLWQKVGDYLFEIKYKLSNYLDERKVERGKSD